jgi:prepilin-type N-terminal cleavage/methylation domain-containing protein
MRCNVRNNFSAGFTLIEMMVALSIFSLLLSILLGGYSQGLSLWQRAIDKSSIWQSYQYRSLWISRLTQQLVLADYRIASGTTKDFFQGNQLGFVAISSAPITTAVGRPVPVEFKLQENIELGYVQLLYREAGKSNDPERGLGLQNRPWLVLIDQINNAHFSYYIQESRDTLDAELSGVFHPFEWRAEAKWTPKQIALTFDAIVDASGKPSPQRWVFNCQSATDAAYQQLLNFMD